MFLDNINVLSKKKMKLDNLHIMTPHTWSERIRGASSAGKSANWTLQAGRPE